MMGVAYQLVGVPASCWHLPPGWWRTSGAAIKENDFMIQIGMTEWETML